MSSPRHDRPAKSNDADTGRAAFLEVVAARKALAPLGTLVSRGDCSAVSDALSVAPFSTLEGNLLTLVQSPLLGPDEKKAIGTIKRYGVGADVLIMVGGLSSALRTCDGAVAKSYISKAENALDEVLLVCRGGGLKP